MTASTPHTIGLPRALLYHRYGPLWRTFFRALGIKTVVSPPTSRKILDQGSALAADETCLSVKIFLGHVQELVGSCDYILIPRISNFGRGRSMCVRFESLYDVTRNLFRVSGQEFLSYNVDLLQNLEEAPAFLSLGQSLGFSPKEVKKAYAAAKKQEQQVWKARLKAQEPLYRAKGLKILVAGHGYILDDPYVGKVITDFLKQSGVIPIRADIVDRTAALKASPKLSPTCKWEFSRELVGSIALHRDQVDGIILLSAFPCGPDAMVNEILVRRLKDIPVLNMVLDGQSGTAGVETRLESFVDIIRFKEGSL
ncbi:acyl-CoA dehydratase activase-related protein [Evtepia sp.]|uniref:acyl-CoA dehydratase activase-related protein n=1 Tax=Evtepia sp. TaxID=2773933 RepID=UPI003F17EB84